MVTFPGRSGIASVGKTGLGGYISDGLSVKGMVDLFFEQYFLSIGMSK